MEEMTKARCSGCENDFYNHRTGFDGATECWSFKNAKVELRKRVHINHVPPWNQEPTPMPSCYHAKGYVFVEGNRTC